MSIVRLSFTISSLIAKFFSNFFSDFFFENLFSIFFPKSYFQNFSKFFFIFFLNFFSIIFFQLFSLKCFFQVLTLDASPLTETKRTLYVSVMRNMICSKRSKSDFRLLWCVEYSSSAHNDHITVDVKSPISSPCCINILFCPSVKDYIYKVLFNKLSRYCSFNNFFFLINLEIFRAWGHVSPPTPLMLEDAASLEAALFFNYIALLFEV